MKTNLDAIIEIVTDFIDIPFFLLPKNKKEKYLEIFRGIFYNLKEKISAKKATDTPVGKTIVNFNNILEKENFDESIFASNLIDLVEKVEGEQTNSIFVSFKNNLQKLLNRAQPLWASEEKAIFLRKQLTTEEINRRDSDMLQKEMQLYALDYFLLMHKLLTEGDDTNQKQIIFQSHENLPPLIQDALQEDMLKKIVYNLIDEKLRQKMLKNYYQYKQVFLAINDKKDLDKDEITEIVKTLKKYCLSLINLSLEYGIKSIKYGLHYPYGKDKNLQDIKMFLEKNE